MAQNQHILHTKPSLRIIDCGGSVVPFRCGRWANRRVRILVMMMVVVVVVEMMMVVMVIVVMVVG